MPARRRGRGRRSRAVRQSRFRLRGLLPETLDVGDLLLALILLLLYLDSEDEDPKSLLIILAVCFFL